MINAEEKIIEALDNTETDYELVEIDPEFSDTAAFCAKYGFPLEKTCNTIIVTSTRGEKKYAACVILANTRLDVNKTVKKLLGVSKASFASREETLSLTGMEIGGVTPFSLPDGLPLYVDERVMKQDWVILGGGNRAIKIKISPDVFAALKAEVITDLAGV